jgi:hypothetical protein
MPHGADNRCNGIPASPLAGEHGRLGGESGGFYGEWTAKMFHVKHLCAPFAGKCFTRLGVTFDPCADSPKGGVREIC